MDPSVTRRAVARARALQIAMAAAIVLLCAFLLSTGYHGQPVAPPQGTVAPDLDLSHAGPGLPARLSGLRGKVVIIDVWATWCGPCRQSIPQLVELYNLYHSSGLEVLGVSIDKPSTQGNIPAAMKAMGMTYPVLLAGKIPGFTEKYGTPGIPALFVLSRSGRLVYSDQGWDPQNALGDRIRLLLKEPAPADAPGGSSRGS